MFKLSLARFSFILVIQFSFLCVDLFLNSFGSILAKSDKILIIVAFLTQDICLILAFTTFIFSLYSTYIYQAGAADFLYTKFRVPFVVLTIYFLLNISSHIWIVFDEFKSPYTQQWPKALSALVIIQRLFSPVYYYLYKRSALRLSDPRFYDNIDWLSEQIAGHK